MCNILYWNSKLFLQNGIKPRRQYFCHSRYMTCESAFLYCKTLLLFRSWRAVYQLPLVWVVHPEEDRLQHYNNDRTKVTDWLRQNHSAFSCYSVHYCPVYINAELKTKKKCPEVIYSTLFEILHSSTFTYMYDLLRVKHLIWYDMT